MWRGAELYRAEAKTPKPSEIWSRRPMTGWSATCTAALAGRGVGLMLILDLACSAPRRCRVAVQMAWIPFWAAGVVNGVGHYWGYRNFEAQDASTNSRPGAS